MRAAVVLLVVLLAGCRCPHEGTDAGVDAGAGELVCLDDDGRSEPCGDVARCAWWSCESGGVCCPGTHPEGCAAGLCARSEAGCEASGVREVCGR